MPDMPRDDRPLSDEDLILFVYGEAEDAEAIRERLTRSAVDRERLTALTETLAMVDELPVAEPPLDYGARVWRAVEPRLDRRRSITARFVDSFGPWLRDLWRAPQTRWAMATAMAGVLLAVGFLAGRHGTEIDAPSPEVRERIVLVAVDRHLERSQLLLVELVNADDPSTLDLAADADILLGANRLVRRAAQRSGDLAASTVLEQLERVLIELSHDPDVDTLTSLRDRIEDQGLLFKVRVVGGRSTSLSEPRPDLDHDV